MTRAVGQHGFTLLEVLIALLILSVGLLGLANLQILGLRSSQGALLRSQATVLAEELAERMQVNINHETAFVDADVNGDNDNDDAYTVASPYVDATSRNADSLNVNCAVRPVAFCASRYNGAGQDAAATCTPAQMAQFDFYNLACGIDGPMAVGGLRALPGGRAVLSCNDADVAAAPADPCGDYTVAGHLDGRCIDGSSHTLTVCWDEIDTASGTTATVSLQYTFVP